MVQVPEQCDPGVVGMPMTPAAENGCTASNSTCTETCRYEPVVAK